VGGDEQLYPVALRLSGRPCLVVGGGPVAARKVAGLVACGARVTVVAPAVDPAIGALATAGAGPEPHPSEEPGAPTTGGLGGTVAVARRPYRPGEAAGYRLVVTATGLPEVDGQVAADAEVAGVWVNSADDPDRCTFVLPSVHRDPPVTVAVSTGGSSPALAGWLRRRLGDAAGPGMGTLAALLEDARRRLRAAGRPTDAVDWRALLDGPLPGLVRDGDVEAAREILRRAVAEATAGPP
jgi:siroheme synthase-like protein